MARIMPPRRFKKKSVKRIVEKRVAKAIEEYEKTRTDSNNAGGSGSANTGGTVAPEMHGCSYKTFTNGKPHSFNGTEATESKGWSKSLVLVTLKGDDIEHTTIRFTNWVLMYPELVSTEKKRFEKLIIRGDFPEESKENAPDKGFEGYTGNLPWKGSVELGFHSCSRRQFATKCDMLGGRKQGLLQEWE
ncbi:hypothetical protein Tco_0257426 [Tanacetum coccineum]